MSDRVDNPDEELQQAFSSSSEGHLVERENVPLVETVGSRTSSSLGVPEVPREPDVHASSSSPEPQVEDLSPEEQLDVQLEEPHASRNVQVQDSSREVPREGRYELTRAHYRTEGDRSRTSRSRVDLNLTSELGSAPARIREELRLDEVMSDSDFWPETRRPSRGRRDSMPVSYTHLTLPTICSV